MGSRHVVVIGAGMVGLSTAWFLQERGTRVTVVDEAGVAAGSSWGNAGWAAPTLTLPLNNPSILAIGVKAALSPSSPVYVPPTANPRLLRFLAQFARHSTTRRFEQSLELFIEANRVSLAAFDQLSAAGVDAPVRVARPLVAAFSSDHVRQHTVSELEHLKGSGGTAEYELLTRGEVLSLEPALGGRVVSGLRLEGQRFIDPARFVDALAASVERRGGEICTGTKVAEVSRHGSTVRVHASRGAELSADAVVIANGAELGTLARRHGVRTLVQAGRGYSFCVQPESMPDNPIYLPGERVACTPVAGGLRIAGMMEFKRPGARPDPRRVTAIVDAVRGMLAGVDWDARTDEWVGSRPCTPDGRPLVGRTRTEGVYVAGGHGMWGIALGPLSGQLLAEEIVTGERSRLLEGFDPLR
jgi:D-amino-acid dehydrogenase